MRRRAIAALRVSDFPERGGALGAVRANGLARFVILPGAVRTIRVWGATPFRAVLFVGLCHFPDSRRAARLKYAWKYRARLPFAAAYLIRIAVNQRPHLASIAHASLLQLG
jgi:hypothetical protein